MVDFAEHRKALLCNDAASIADYESAMDQQPKRLQHGCKTTRCIPAVASKELRNAIAFNPSKEGLGVQNL